MVATRRLQSGMILAKPVLGANGRILLQRGVELTGNYIRKLHAMNIPYVYIQDADTYDIEIEEMVSVEVQQEVLAKVKRIYDKVADPAFSDRMIQSGEIGKEFTQLFKVLFDALLQNRTFVVNLTAIYSSDSYLYTHCMNVGTMASVLGVAKGFDRERLMKFGVGAMLHDIGKLRIDKDILDKPGQLTPEERAEIERHCKLGYDILVRQPDISVLSAHCALQHHEKFDGSGYPRGLRGMEIHEFGRILAVPDVYDALTSNRAYRKALLPHEAVEYLYAMAGTHFDPACVHLFSKCVNVYPNGLPVRLSNGCTGVVARSNRGNWLRPVVLVLEEAGRKVTPYELDLQAELSVTITACELADDFQGQVAGQSGKVV